MNSHTPAPSKATTWAAAAAVVAVLARVASIFLWPPDSDAGDAKMLATAQAHYRAWTAATAIETVAWVAAGCAVLVAITLVKSRGRLLTLVGGGLYGASLITLGLVGGAMNSVTGVLAREPNRALMVQVQGDLESPVLNACVALILLGNLMAVVFALGLVRARILGWWFPVVSVGAVLAYGLTSASGDHLVVLASFVPLGVTWLALASRLTDGGATPDRLVTGDAGVSATRATSDHGAVEA
ncbi:MAG: hypothetical protein ACTHKG_15845 [Nocardioides sp.]